jgi:hypothetical protein
MYYLAAEWISCPAWSEQYQSNLLTKLVVEVGVNVAPRGIYILFDRIRG